MFHGGLRAMEGRMKQNEKQDVKQAKPDGMASRMAAHNAVRRAGGSPREAIRAYCQGNKWLTENAKAVGNW
jgi:hypothetical protein